MAAPRPGPSCSSSSAAFLTGCVGAGGGGYQHHHQLQQQQFYSGGGSGGGGRGHHNNNNASNVSAATATAAAPGFSDAAAAASSSPVVAGAAAAAPPHPWFEHGGMLPSPPAHAAAAAAAAADYGRGAFGFVGYDVSGHGGGGFGGCGGEAGEGFAALGNAMGYGAGGGLFSPVFYAGVQEGMAMWQGLVSAGEAEGTRQGRGRVGVRKREVEEDEFMVVQAEEQGGGLGGLGHQQQDEDEDGGGVGGGSGFGFGFHESSSGSEFSRSSSENLKGGLLRLRRARRVGGGGSKKKKRLRKTTTTMVVGKDAAAAAASESPVSADERPESGRKKRREMESPVPWTEDMVRFLFETYDDVHRRLWIESRGKVKNQKKWDPIIRTMQDKFGRDFTKNQCESKYWKVRRECARFKSKTSAVAAAAEPLASPSGGGGGVISSRDVVKPKFYDVWLEVAGNDPVKLPDIDVSSGSGEDDDGLPSPGGAAAGLADQDEYASPFRTTGWDAAATATATAAAAAGPSNAGGGGGSTSTVREMKQFLSSHHEASEKREEDLSFKAGATLEAVRDHMTRMKRRGSMLDIAGKAQLSVLQGVENKLDRLLHGLTALNGNIGAMVGILATLPQR